MSDPVPPIRVAVVGFGFGRHLVETLVNLPEYRLVAVADRRHGGLDAAAHRLGFAAHRDALAMMDGIPLDAVCIATSPRARGPLLAAAAQHGLPVFVEKPWAADVEHARELAEIASASSARVMVGFSFRFHPAVRRLRSLIDSGELGRPRMLHGRYCFGWLPGPDHWMWDEANGNGFFNENSCHLFDAVCHLMGRPIEVFAQVGREAGRPMEDSASIVMRFPEGAHATLNVGGIGSPAFADDPRIELYGENGQAELLGRHHIYRALRWAGHGDKEVREAVLEPELLAATRYGEALQHFAACVRGGSPDGPSSTVADGVLAVEIAMAVTRSARTGKPVSL